jgi:hypothetical protein
MRAMFAPWQSVLPDAALLAKRSACPACLPMHHFQPHKGTTVNNKGTTVNTLNINAIALAVSLMFSAGAMAQSVSKGDYKAGKDRITAESKLARASCASLSGNPNDICMAGVEGNEKFALAATPMQALQRIFA